MRIAISALLGMTVMLSGAIASAQPAPEPPKAPEAAPPSDLPPPPPPPGAPVSPGASGAAEPIAPVPSPFPVEGESADERMDLVGFRMGDGAFIRDSRDNFRLYPYGLFELDVYGSAGPGVPDAKNKVIAPDLATSLKPRLFARRARIGFMGELFKRWSFAGVVEFGGQPLTNVPGGSGPAEITAAKPGQTPTATSARYQPIQNIGGGVTAVDVWVGYSVCKCLNFQVGHFHVPFSMDNRTGAIYYPMMERTLGVRAFLLPFPRDLGGMIWGELGPKVFNYEIGIFGGDGQNRPSPDASVDFMGRIFARPFAGSGTSDLAKYTQIGMSARHGDRDPKSIGYDYQAFTTSQGFALWKPTYTDSLGRLVHIMPSGAQNTIGGEFRMQVWRFALQGEAYYSVNGTREAVDGYQLTTTERLGRMKGVGWYAQLSAWPLGDSFIRPEPGMNRPRHLDLKAKDSPKVPHGVELIAQVSGINANYDGAARLGSKADANTPSGDITIYQIGGGLTYWHSRHVRVGFNYMAYLTPGSGTKENQAVVPDNVQQTDGKAGTGHIFHELSGRIAVGF